MPRTRRSVADKKKADSGQHKFTGFHRAGVFVLLAFIISQSLIIFNVADAGDITAKSLLECTNTIRLKYQKNELVINEKLNLAAQKKLEDMIKAGYWAHENPETHQKPWDFVDASGYYYETTGENLALGFETAQAACNAWEKSKTHLENIKDPTYQEIGFAIDKANLHKNGKGILIVQMFGSRLDFGNTSITQENASQSTLSLPSDSGSPPASDPPDKISPADPQNGISSTLHASSAEAGPVGLLKNIMPYITGLFYVTTIFVVILKGKNKKKPQNGFSNALILFLAVSSIFSSLIYLVLT